MTISRQARSLARADGKTRKKGVQQMFNGIAGHYDLLNHLLTCGIDRSWRRKTVCELGPEAEGVYLDVATGTGDLGFEILKRGGGCVVGLDFASGMLNGLKQKFPDHEPCHFRLVQGDAETLPFRDASFAGASIGFGIRNIPDQEQALREILRVLEPGRKLVILELSIPTNRLLRRLYLLYFRHILPRVGTLISRENLAYGYLPESVRTFLSRDDFCRLMMKSGFSHCQYRSFTLGLVTLYYGQRPSDHSEPADISGQPN